jgi:hypothetical protein
MYKALGVDSQHQKKNKRNEEKRKRKKLKIEQPYNPAILLLVTYIYILRK